LHAPATPSYPSFAAGASTPSFADAGAAAVAAALRARGITQVSFQSDGAAVPRVKYSRVEIVFFVLLFVQSLLDNIAHTFDPKELLCWVSMNEN
jgi:hypothetical protein